MKIRPLASVFVLMSWSFFLLAMAWPVVALVGKCLAQGEPPTEGWTYSGRQLGLLGRTCGLAGIATILCIIVSLPGAYMLGSGHRLGHRPIIAAACLALLLCPPMVYAFAWEKILPVNFDPYVRCIGVWVLWAWPIPAVLLGTGWSRTGRYTYEAALTEAPPSAAFLQVALPPMFKFVALSAVILFVLYFGDYGVPHACGLTVYATELLGWAASSTRTIDTVWPGLLGVIVVGLALTGGFVAWRRCFTNDDGESHVPPPQSSSGWLWALGGGVFVVSWLLPIGVLITRLGAPDPLLTAFRVYGRDLLWSLGVAVLAGAAAMSMGLGIMMAPRLRTVVLVWAVAFGAIPGALVGESLVAGYNHHSLWWLYDYWPIVGLSYLARFGWVGVLTAMVMTTATRSELVGQAQTDGATRMGVLTHVYIPANWPTILGGLTVVAALSIADIAACSLVRVPGYGPISLILMDKFHFFEDGMLISLSLWLIATSLPAVLLFTTALRRSP